MREAALDTVESAETPQSAGRRGRRALGPAAVGVAVLSVLALLGTTDPHAGIPWLPVCPVKALTGLDCPGCGGTRATWDLIHLDPARAMHDNALVFLILPALALGWAAWLAAALGNRPVPRIPSHVVLAAVAVAAAWMLLRNMLL